MDQNSALILIGTAMGSAKLVEKLLGPTAEYMGGGVKYLTEKGVNNIGRILGKAVNKLGHKINEPGSVPPKVLKGILTEGAFCEDELSAEYFGGILASSRTGVSRDDRGAAYIALLSRLSSYQIRAHYCFYHIFKRAFDGQQINLTSKTGQNICQIIIALSTYERFMGFDEKENPINIFSHIMSGLSKESLIRDAFGTGSGKLLGDTDFVQVYDREEGIFKLETKEDLGGLMLDWPRPNETMFGIYPTIAGIELFLWAYGRTDMEYSEFFSSSIQFNQDEDIRISDEFFGPYMNQRSADGETTIPSVS